MVVVCLALIAVAVWLNQRYAAIAVSVFAVLGLGFQVRAIRAWIARRKQLQESPEVGESGALDQSDDGAA